MHTHMAWKMTKDWVALSAHGNGNGIKSHSNCCLCFPMCIPGYTTHPDVFIFLTQLQVPKSHANGHEGHHLQFNLWPITIAINVSVNVHTLQSPTCFIFCSILVSLNILCQVWSLPCSINIPGGLMVY
jgi:hypothetical protein